MIPAEAPQKFRRIVEKSAAGRILGQGMNITSDQLIEFFWSTFLKLKEISTKERSKHDKT